MNGCAPLERLAGLIPVDGEILEMRETTHQNLDAFCTAMGTACRADAGADATMSTTVQAISDPDRKACSIITRLRRIDVRLGARLNTELLPPELVVKVLA